MYVDVPNGRLWVEDEGDGPPVLFLHGGLGDGRLFEPQARALADAYRCIRPDLRLWGRTETEAVSFSWIDDAAALLDALDVERAAVVGLSMGAGLALDLALLRPERVTGLVHIAGGMSGSPVSAYTPEQEARAEREGWMDVDFEVWAPLGADDTMRELWQSTPEAKGVPEGADPAPRPDAQPEQLACPVLVVVAKHDPPAQVEVGRELARRAPDARLAEVDSDHYLTLREPELVTRLVRDFLATL
jgi:pimeloyl-ACP methyl ester carboxylesterase